MTGVQIKTVQTLDIKTNINDITKNTYTFLTRYPTASDSDQNGHVYVFKPKGWPELIQPQYKNSACHILATKGYWSRLHWSTLNKYTYTARDWRKRLHYTHWKPLNIECNGYLFDPIIDFEPKVPDGLEWDTFDWSEICSIVDQAYDLMLQGVSADQDVIMEVHYKLKKVLDDDDVFYLNQWINFCRDIKTLDM